MERTFVMMKPGVVQRRIAGEVLSRFEKKGLKLVALKLMRISPELAKKHYAEHADKPFFGELVQYITSGPVVAMAFEGDDAVAIVRKLCGATKVLNHPGRLCLAYQYQRCPFVGLCRKRRAGTWPVFSAGRIFQLGRQQ